MLRIELSGMNWHAGLLITYTIMLGDVLVGKPPAYNGVITNIVGDHSGDLWYLDRRFVVSSLSHPRMLQRPN